MTALKLVFSTLAFFLLIVFILAGLLAIVNGLGVIWYNILFVFVAVTSMYALYCWNINEFR
jgi:hypothetical protein